MEDKKLQIDGQDIDTLPSSFKVKKPLALRLREIIRPELVSITGSSPCYDGVYIKWRQCRIMIAVLSAISTIIGTIIGFCVGRFL